LIRLLILGELLGCYVILAWPSNKEELIKKS